MDHATEKSYLCGLINLKRMFVNYMDFSIDFC